MACRMIAHGKGRVLLMVNMIWYVHAKAIASRSSSVFKAPRNLGVMNFSPLRLELAPSARTRIAEMSGQFYARWAPPAKSATRRTPSPTAHSPTPQTKRASETPDTTERKKHKDKSKRKSIEASSKVLGSPQDERSHTSNHTIDEYGEPRKKSKKRKRESLVDNQPEAQDEAIPKKHRTILTKFERSSERAEAVRAAAESDLEEEHQEEMPAKKLHGMHGCPRSRTLLMLPRLDTPSSASSRS